MKILILLLFSSACYGQTLVVDTVYYDNGAKVAVKRNAATSSTPTTTRLADTAASLRDAINLKANTTALSFYSTTAQANALYQPAGAYLVAADIAGKANTASPAFTGAVTTTGSIGYATGAGGTVTQNANKTTAVTLNKNSGQITMNNAALTAGSEVAFTLNNSTIAATDVVIVNVQSVGTAGAYLVGVGAVANGSCSITVSNASAGSLSQAIVLNFVVIKAVNN